MEKILKYKCIWNISYKHEKETVPNKKTGDIGTGKTELDRPEKEMELCFGETKTRQGRLYKNLGKLSMFFELS